jgi:hypothetical protein
MFSSCIHTLARVDENCVGDFGTGIVLLWAHFSQLASTRSDLQQRAIARGVLGGNEAVAPELRKRRGDRGVRVKVPTICWHNDGASAGDICSW